MNPKLKLAVLSLSGLLLIVSLIVIATRPPEEDSIKRSAFVSYIQWVVSLSAGDPKACSVMTEEAQKAYVLQVAVSDNSKSCSQTVKILSSTLDRRQPYEPYIVAETARKNIKKTKFLSDKKVLIWSSDFNQGKEPVVLEAEDDGWLVSSESFIQNTPNDKIQWISGKPD